MDESNYLLFEQVFHILEYESYVRTNCLKIHVNRQPEVTHPKQKLYFFLF